MIRLIIDGFFMRLINNVRGGILSTCSAVIFVTIAFLEFA
jgi:hypothetical protein